MFDLSNEKLVKVEYTRIYLYLVVSTLVMKNLTHSSVKIERASDIALTHSTVNTENQRPIFRRHCTLPL